MSEPIPINRKPAPPLPPRQWKIILVIRDNPDVGLGYLTEEEIISIFTSNFDLPTGIDIAEAVIIKP